MVENRELILADFFQIQDLKASIGDKQILKGVNLEIKPGEIHAIMGKNGSGKSTLSNIIMGHPSYTVQSGDIRFLGESILSLKTDERSRKGIFLSFQYPTPIPGVNVTSFLRTIMKANLGKDLPAREFRTKMKESMNALQINDSFASRYINDGFSGGEKKRHEILQLSMLDPRLVIFDEIDSGLDIDALKVVCEGILKNHSKEKGILVITHYQRLLSYIVPDYIHIFVDGQIVKSGKKELALELEEKGYDQVING